MCRPLAIGPSLKGKGRKFQVGVVVGRGLGETSGGRHAEQKAERPEPAGQNSPWTLSIAMIGVDRAPCSSVQVQSQPGSLDFELRPLTGWSLAGAAGVLVEQPKHAAV